MHVLRTPPGSRPAAGLRGKLRRRCARHRRHERPRERHLQTARRTQGGHQGLEARNEDRPPRLLHRPARRVRAPGRRPGRRAPGWRTLSHHRGLSCRSRNCSRRSMTPPGCLGPCSISILSASAPPPR
ncbi:hypothetical protein G6F22_017022 [Rhizopus arrhizus]|nr:hypothetical protein G6F22_017022 [Rhizopus arrhizus]